jgi:hypothetical protein
LEIGTPGAGAGAGAEPADVGAEAMAARAEAAEDDTQAATVEVMPGCKAMATEGKILSLDGCR